MNRYIPFLVFVLLMAAALHAGAQDHGPAPLIIDMHLHASRVADFGASAGSAPRMCSTNEGTMWLGWDPRKPFKVEDASSCAGTMVPGATTDDGLMRQTLSALKRYNIRAVTSSGTEGDLERVSRWREASRDRIIPAASFLRPGHEPRGRRLFREIAELRRLVSESKIAVFAEVAPQYAGMSPADPALEPYFRVG